jgi:hypothetical protein
MSASWIWGNLSVRYAGLTRDRRIRVRGRMQGVGEKIPVKKIRAKLAVR